MVALSLHVLLLLLCPFVLPPILPQILSPHLLLCLILECIINPSVLFSCSLELKPFFVFSKTLMQMFLTYICPKLWNEQTTFSHGTIFLPHISNMTMNATMISLPMAECSTHQHSPLFSTLFHLFSTFFLPPLLFTYVHFSVLFNFFLTIFYNFSITLSTLILL